MNCLLRRTAKYIAVNGTQRNYDSPSLLSFSNSPKIRPILNSCDNPAPLKLFKAGIATQFKIMDEDVVDAIIFRTWNPRNLLMLELMVWSCMRVGEVLKLKPKDMKIVMLSLPEKVIKQVLTKMVFLR